MTKNKKNITIDKSLVFLFIVFSGLFFVKAYLYNIIGNDALIGKIFNFIPERILFYIFIPIFYIFLVPVEFVLENLRFYYSSGNQFVTFSLDIVLTIIYLTILYFLFKSVFYLFKKRKN